MSCKKKIVCLITFNDKFPVIPGPLVHTPPLFHELKTLKIYDIYKLQVGKFVYESINQVGPSQAILRFLKASEIHDYCTRYADGGNFFVDSVRTNRYGLKSLKVEGKKYGILSRGVLKNAGYKKIF